MPPDLPQSSPALRTPHALSTTRPKERQYGTYLYRRGNLYYFRLIFPDDVKAQVGNSEIRLSLKTGYLREAKRYAAILTGALKMALSGDCMLTYHEIRSRMHRLLQDLLMRDAQEFGSYHISLPKINLEITPTELYSGDIKLLQRTIADESLLRIMADRCIPGLIKKGIFSSDEVTDDNKLLIAKAYGETQIALHNILCKKEEGDFLTETQVLSPLFAPSAQATASIAPEKPVSVLFSQAMEKYVQEKLDDGKWRETTLPDHKYRLASFQEIMGDMPVDSITNEDMREFRNTLRKLPPNRSRNPAYAGKSIAEIVAMEPKKTLNVKTINTTVEAVGSLLDWCVDKRYIQYNPAKRLQLKNEQQDIEARDSFTQEDLQLIFAHPKFSEGEFKYPSYFWMPLIGLYTGMRLEEIAQLHCADLHESETKGIWVFDLNTKVADELGFKKSLKNNNAVRIIPIHDDLLRLGILDYHKSVVAKKHVRLFPELSRTKSGDYGKQPSKQFKDVIKKVLTEHGKKVFHSLRHTFTNFYKQRGLQDDPFHQLCGHELEHIGKNTYGEKFPADLLYHGVIKKLDYGLDLSALMNSRFLSVAQVVPDKKRKQ